MTITEADNITKKLKNLIEKIQMIKSRIDQFKGALKAGYNSRIEFQYLDSRDYKKDDCIWISQSITKKCMELLI